MISLEQLRDFARGQGPDRQFDLNDSCGCLVATMVGGEMEGFDRYSTVDGGGRVNDAFAQFSRYYVERFPISAGVDHAYITAAKLIPALDSLIAGRHPKDVADEV